MGLRLFTNGHIQYSPDIDTQHCYIDLCSAFDLHVRLNFSTSIRATLFNNLFSPRVKKITDRPVERGERQAKIPGPPSSHGGLELSAVLIHGRPLGFELQTKVHKNKFLFIFV